VTEVLLAVLGLLIVLVLDLLAVAARASFTQTSYVRLLALREPFGDRIQRTLALLPALPRLRASLNLTLVITRFLAAGLTVALVLWRSVAYPALAALVGLMIAGLLMFWLEWGIEKTALRSPENSAYRLTGFVRFLMSLLTVLLVPLALSNEATWPAESPTAVTQDELRILVDAGQEEGLFQQVERRMIYSVIGLGDTLAREIMVPRIDMLALGVETSLLEAVDILLRAGHSRVPVFEETVDNLLGLLYAKDLLRSVRDGNLYASLRDLLRPAYFVPEAKKVDELLAEMQIQRIHMAIVVDEYGGVAGLVTLEDIVEEILGEIQDEYDQAEEAPYQKLSDGGYVFLGRIGLDDFNEIMGSHLTSDEADTLSGYIYDELGHVPSVGETVLKNHLLLTVEHVSSRRIRKVSAHWLSPDVQSAQEQDHVE
jgi:CBS domain containing-hemolysin-like protein